MNSMAEEGVICFHTSSWYFEFPPLLADACKQMGFAYKRGHDAFGDPERRELSHFSSEWVMVASKQEYMKHLVAPEGYKVPLNAPKEPFWTVPDGPGRYTWTDAGKKKA